MFLFSLMLAAALQHPVPVKPPRLINRAEMVELRRQIAKKYMHPGDSVLVHVTVFIDTMGVVRDPHADDHKDTKVAALAVLYVKKMRFQPAMENGRKKAVMVKIPVVLAR